MFHPITVQDEFRHDDRMSEAARLKLLIVDDHAAFRATLSQMFDANTTETIEAKSGEEALEKFAQLRPDWVIMDIRMPGMGGIKATAAIRQIDPRAQVIVTSQFTEVEYREQARRAGAVEFVDKEDLSRLVKIIQDQRLQG